MKLGECYDNALVALFERSWPNCTDVRLVHGYPKLRQADKGSPAGTRYGHAWVEARLEECPDVVLCFALTPDHVLPQDVYYAPGCIDEPYVSRYTKAEAVEEMAKWEHSGPWVEDAAMPPGTEFAD